MNRHRNRAFAVETLLLTLFFLLALALLVQLFGAAQAMGRQARQETDAALLLQNASAQLHAGADPWAQAMAAAAQTGAPQTAEAAFAADGTPAPAGAANAYTVRIAFTPAPQNVSSKPAQRSGLVQSSSSSTVGRSLAATL